MLLFAARSLYFMHSSPCLKLLNEMPEITMEPIGRTIARLQRGSNSDTKEKNENNTANKNSNGYNNISALCHPEMLIILNFQLPKLEIITEAENTINFQLQISEITKKTRGSNSKML